MPEDFETWKLFIKARIDQERGEHDVALANLRKALKRDPDNPFFLHAEAQSLRALGKVALVDEHSTDLVARKYAESARKNMGQQDRPEIWIAELRSLLQEIEMAEGQTRKIDWRKSVSNVW